MVEKYTGVQALFNGDLQSIMGFEDRQDWIVLSRRQIIFIGSYTRCETCPLKELSDEEGELLCPIALSYSDWPVAEGLSWQEWAEDVSRYDVHPDSRPELARLALINASAATPEQIEMARACSYEILDGNCELH